VINIHLPPLRTRGEDLVLLAKYFLHQFAQQYDALGKQFAAETLSAIKQYPWPGNIRELRNRVQKALILSERSQISMEDLDIPSSALTPILSLADAKERFQSQYINQILDLHAGNRTQTAKALGVDPRTIFRHLEKEQEKERQAQDPYEP
ncbi:MAG: helix-turn-helix domain-containing protein, partial [Myxococcota bacterium]